MEITTDINGLTEFLKNNVPNHPELKIMDRGTYWTVRDKDDNILGVIRRIDEEVSGISMSWIASFILKEGMDDMKRLMVGQRLLNALIDSIPSDRYIGAVGVTDEAIRAYTTRGMTLRYDIARLYLAPINPKKIVEYLKKPWRYVIPIWLGNLFWGSSKLPLTGELRFSEHPKTGMKLVRCFKMEKIDGKIAIDSPKKRSDYRRMGFWLSKKYPVILDSRLNGEKIKINLKTSDLDELW